MKDQAQNTFTDGLITDFHPLTCKNSILTDALNATIVTTKGNEMVLQNDLGNLKVKDSNGTAVKLSDGFIPIGVKEYHDVMYIASYNPQTKYCELGTFPSPDYDSLKEYTQTVSDTVEYSLPMLTKYQPLKNIITNKDISANIKFSDLISFTTKLLNFDINHPVNIEIQASYDGSVNLILNDGQNIPRLINSRFSVLQNSTAKIPVRRHNDDNLYEINNQVDFDIETSLIKRLSSFPTIDYNGVLNTGNLKVGNYVFYFKYCDSDGNETDWIGESGIITVFKGNDGDPFSIDGGLEDMNAYKSIRLTLSSIDTAYNYIKVYYARSSAAKDQDRVTTAHEISEPYEIKEDTCNITITGDETTLDVGLSEIQQSYQTIDSAKTQTQCQNMLFQANIKEADIYYNDLTDLSLHIIPSVSKILSKEVIGHIDSNTYLDNSEENTNNHHYFKNEYYNTKNIYYNVGYWNEEYYRLGIVYIYDNNSLSNVYNVMGGELNIATVNKAGTLTLDTSAINTKLLKGELSGDIDSYINSERQYFTVSDNKIENSDINTCGVIHINDAEGTGEYTTDQFIYRINLTFTSEIIAYLTKVLHIKGFFIVRQKRIPTILCQGYTLPWDKESKVPVVEYWGKSIPYFNDNDTSKTLFDNYTTYLKTNSVPYYDDKVTDTYNNPYIHHKMYFVESFLRQCNEESWALYDVNNINIQQQITHEYLPRLYNILPCCIDTKLLDTVGGTATKADILNISFYFSYNDLTANTLQELNQDIIDTITLSETYTCESSYLDPNIPLYVKVKYVDKIDTTHTLSPITIKTGMSATYNIDTSSIETSLATGILASDVTIDVAGKSYVMGYSEYTCDNTSYTQTDLISKINSTNPTLVLNYKSATTDTATTSKTLFNYSTTTNVATITKMLVKNGYAADEKTSYYYTYQPISKETGIVVNEDTQTRYISNYYTNRIVAENNNGRHDSIPNLSQAVIKHLYYLYKYCDGNQLTAICPEFETSQAFYNQFFTGSKYNIKYTNYQQGILHRLDNNERLYYPAIPDNFTVGTTNYTGVENFYSKQSGSFVYKICSVTDNVPSVAVDDTIFKSVIGSDQEAFRFSYINEEGSAIRWNYDDRFNGQSGQDFNLSRGIYSPYLGIVAQDGKVSEKTKGYCRTFNIYYNNEAVDAFKLRFEDTNPYYAISDRVTISSASYSLSSDGKKLLALTNLNSSPSDTLDMNIYRGDCFLCTFTHRLNRNFNDPTSMSNDKIIDSTTWNTNYTSGVDKLDKINRGDVNAVKMGSWITIKVKASKNLSIRSLDGSFTTEAATMGRDRGFYPLQQATADGGYKITSSYVFNDGFGTTVGVKAYNTLPKAAYIKNEYSNRISYSDINVIDNQKNGYRTFRATHYRDYTKQYGSITKLIDLESNLLCVFEHGIALIPVNERALATESSGGAVYINTSNVLPENINILSDIYGSKWADSIIKTPYYVYGVDTNTGKIWSTNGNTVKVISDFRVGKFLNENINLDLNENTPTLGLTNVVSHYDATKSDLLFTFYNKRFIDGNYESDEVAWSLGYNIVLGGEDGQFVTFYSWIPLYSANLNHTFYTFDREQARDTYLQCYYLNKFKTNYPNDTTIQNATSLLEIKEYLTANNMTIPTGYGLDTNGNVEFIRENNTDRLVPYIWKHGPVNNTLPYTCFWYDEQHPFEFEFVINEKPNIQKIWEDMEMISNKAVPESFHFTIVGEGYDFSEDKPNMYVRQEATKQLLQNLGSDISYNDNYNKLITRGLLRQPKSTIFPLYYDNINTTNDIYDSYTVMSGGGRNYCNLSGSEIAWDEALNDFVIKTHIKNSPITGYWKNVKKDEYDSSVSKKYIDTREGNNYYYVWDNVTRVRGNSQYQEDGWIIQIPSITLTQKNEDWSTLPPLVVNASTIPADLSKFTIDPDDLPNTYNIGQVSTDNWTFRKETKLRDKYIKIKIRYSGKDPVIITSILTTFNLSAA